MLTGIPPERRLMAPPPISGRILDIGSGTGRWTGHLAGLGHAVVGVDPSEDFIEHVAITAIRTHPGDDLDQGQPTPRED